MRTNAGCPRVKAQTKQEREYRVRLVREQPAQHIQKREVVGGRRQTQQLLFGGHDGRAGKRRHVHEKHAEQGDAAEHVHALDPLGQLYRCRAAHSERHSSSS